MNHSVKPVLYNDSSDCHGQPKIGNVPYKDALDWLQQINRHCYILLNGIPIGDHFQTISKETVLSILDMKVPLGTIFSGGFTYIDWLYRTALKSKSDQEEKERVEFVSKYIPHVDPGNL